MKAWILDFNFCNSVRPRLNLYIIIENAIQGQYSNIHVIRNNIILL